MKTPELLIKLSNAFGPVGYEDEVRKIIQEEIEPYVDEVKVDNLGNLIVFKRGTGKKKVAFFTHIDEVSLVVSAKDERGFLRFDTLGGIDPKVLIAQRVKVVSKDGKVRRGVIGVLAPHLQKAADRKNIPPMDEMFIDVSMNPDYEKIEIGDLVVVDTEAFESNGKVIGKALDDRACAVISILVAKQLSKFSRFPDVYFVFTSREEVGGMGARVAAEAIQPDVGIAMDVTHAHKRTGIELGKGPAITVGGPNIHKGYFKMLDDVAKREGVKVQYEIAAGGTGTDADNVQISGTGIPTLLVSLPNKFMHTPVEVVQVSDVEESARLLVNFLFELEEGEENEA